MGPMKRALRRLAHRIAPPELLTAIKFLRAESNPVFPKRNIVVTNAVPKGRVLVLSPHPDDEAIGMGGSLAKHVAGGASVTVLFLTDGGGLEAERDEQIRVRRAESEAVGRDLGIDQVFWDHEDTKLRNDPATVEALVALLAQVRPEHIYTPSFFDTHFDHYATNQILADAIGRASLDATIYGYEVWDTIPFANYLVDVSDSIEDKDRILAHYVTPHEYTDFTGLCRNRASVHYTLHVNSERSQAGKGFAEAFLRFDAATYRRLHESYASSLRSAGSELPVRLQR